MAAGVAPWLSSDRGDLDFEPFLKTGKVTYDLDSQWCTNMRRQTGEGKRVGRARIVDDPPTQGQLFLLAYAECNAATGEDIRNLRRADAERLHLPEADFWVFDSRLVALLNFDDADVLLNVEIITEPAEVNRYMQAFDAAMHHATPYRQFAAQMKR